MNIIAQLEKEQMAIVSAKRQVPDFAPGDTVIVNVKVVEGERSRIQAYEGLVIGRSGGGINENFTVRKMSYGEGVERIFPVYSPMIDSIKVIRRGKVRRAKLYYLKGLTGKRARITEKLTKFAAAVMPSASPAEHKDLAPVAADDVSLIAGVGPKIKDQLIAEGITSLNQIADMNDEQIFALDEKLGLKGKSKREDWVGQAKELVAGQAPRAKIDQKAAEATAKA